MRTYFAKQRMDILSLETCWPNWISFIDKYKHIKPTPVVLSKPTKFMLEIGGQKPTTAFAAEWLYKRLYLNKEKIRTTRIDIITTERVPGFIDECGKFTCAVMKPIFVPTIAEIVADCNEYIVDIVDRAIIALALANQIAKINLLVSLKKEDATYKYGTIGKFVVPKELNEIVENGIAESVRRSPNADMIFITKNLSASFMKKLSKLSGKNYMWYYQNKEYLVGKHSSLLVVNGIRS